MAQKKNENFKIDIKETKSLIKIDGVLDEQGWQEAAVADNFYMVLPMDTSRADVKTDVRMTYDKNNIYIIAQCFNGKDGNYIVESLRRDWGFLKNDNFIVFIDPFNDQTNGFAFGANAAGAQWDGLMYEGGRVDLSWDNKWESVVKVYTDKWIFEAAIPFKTMRFKKGIAQWGINFSRNDLPTTEKSSWAPMPRQFPTAAMAYNGNLIWDAPPPTPGTNISLIPYALGGISKNYEKNTPSVKRADIGGDAKIAVSSSLNLDITINPDFSQVEVDRQVTNLDRFELFFPERRQFFLENGDLFSNFGYSSIRPFFSRRIGLNVPILFGARLSGKLNQDWRIGAMTMQTDKVASTGLPSQNFTVFSLQRKVFARSNIGILGINKSSFNYNPNDVNGNLPKYSTFNRNIGLEYNLASNNGFWTGKFFTLKSFSPNKSGDDYTHAANIQYNSRKWNVSWQQEYVGKNYNAEVGFVPRTGFIKLNPSVMRLFFPKGGKVLSHSIFANSNQFFDKNFNKTDNESFIAYTSTFRSRSTLMGWIAHNYVKLLQPFDPTNLGRDTLARNSEHRWNALGLEFNSKPQSLFTFSSSMRYGGYYADGKRLSLSGEAGYRFQPFVSMALSANYNDIDLPKPWGRTKFWLLGPRLDITATSKLFFTTFFQYNEQLKNVNLNTRLQWRYKPASDLFIVYTDNYLPENFKIKNRALVLKFTYWWNI